MVYAAAWVMVLATKPSKDCQYVLNPSLSDLTYKKYVDNEGKILKFFFKNLYVFLSLFSHSHIPAFNKSIHKNLSN